MDNFHIYIDGERSRRANMQMKIDNIIEARKQRLAATMNRKLEDLEYYWTHHEKLVR